MMSFSDGWNLYLGALAAEAVVMLSILGLFVAGAALHVFVIEPWAEMRKEKRKERQRLAREAAKNKTF